MGSKRKLGIGLMGLGVVGGGVAEALLKKNRVLAEEIGCRLDLRKVLVRDRAKPRAVSVDSDLLTVDPQQILASPEIDIVIEVIGGEQPALEYIRQALLNGKHVVTANKEVVAKHGSELLRMAQEKGVSILYEASVGGGIPLLLPLHRCLLANDIATIYAIINGTTNYILTRMSGEGMSFGVALKKAQELGYAEPDAANDIEGRDAAYKLAILATVAFHTIVRPEDIYCQGISRLCEVDFRYARELGYEIKLLAIAKQRDGAVEVRVHPVFIPTEFLLAKVDGVYNAVQIEGDLVGKLIFYGRGAGAQPTASAVISDVIETGRVIAGGERCATQLRPPQVMAIRPISELETRYYLRMSIADQPGVLAQIAKILGDRSISIASVIQKEADDVTQSAEIVIMTHPARERFMQQSLSDMENLSAVREVGNLIRVEG
jgi:homoserine dehydrogenase